ncbi:MAG: choice-of-anchor L domain-containing protein [Caulobacteraceae bacterium]|nr:choice-of-anchor L domain-containing protein [Caulobacteraceae bacterium]
MAITFQPLNDPAPSALDVIVDNLLQGSGATLVAGSVSYIGGNGQGATFTDGAAAVGIASGLLLTSGDGTPPTSNSFDGFGSSLGLSGDADLTNATTDSSPTEDANILTFSVLVSDPAVTSLTFSFVFASEEYPEFVNQYADIAVVMANGVNYALFPNGQPLTVTSDNLEAFRRNTGDLLPDNSPPPGPQVSLPIEYDGVSQVLTVTVPVSLGVNSIKLGIADTNDGALDSAIFIGSIVTGNAPAGPISGGNELSISPPAISHAEGNVGPTLYDFTVTRSGDLTGAASVGWAVTGSGLNAANASDFTGGLLPSGSVSFAAGESSKVVQVSVNGDFAVETNEGFTVTLSGAVGASIGAGSASGTIVNDDVGGPTTLSIGPASIDLVEGDSGTQLYTYTVTRGGTVSGTSTVSWSVAGFGASAASAADFLGGVLPSGSLSFAIGETSKTIEIRVNGDLAFEPDETFQVTLSAPTGASIATNQALGGILNDDDPAPSPLLSAPALTLLEGGPGETQVFAFTVTRFGDLSQALSGTWTLLEPASGPSVNSVDVQAVGGTVSFAAGVATAQVLVTVLGDSTPESSEGFTLRVNLPGFDPLTAQGLVVNDDVVGGSAMGAGEADMMSFAAPAVVYGLSGGDQITGSSGADYLDGGDGRDWLRAAGGDDVLLGGAGDDVLDGGDGFDIARLDGRAADYAWWSNPDGSWTLQDLRADGLDGVDLLFGVEQLAFADRSIDIAGLSSAQSLALAFENVLRRAPASAADQAFLSDLSGKVADGALSMPQAMKAIVDAADATTAVALLTYQLFTGEAPGKAGVDYLVAEGGGNANSLNSAYYADFNLENRYINFAVNLGTAGEGRAAFEADYGGLSLDETFDLAYGRIFGFAAETGKAEAVLGGQVGEMTRADYFAAYGGDALGTKAALVGWLLAEAAKADIGPYASASNAYLLDLADGAPFRVDLVGVYGPAGDGDGGI